jgi:hypothetical protein
MKARSFHQMRESLHGHELKYAILPAWESGAGDAGGQAPPV